MGKLLVDFCLLFHCSCFDRNTLQHLMISGPGVLLPPSMSKVMDAMEVWGRSRSYTWYQETLAMFAFYIDQRISVSEQEVVFETIKLRVGAMICCHD